MVTATQTWLENPPASGMSQRPENHDRMNACSNRNRDVIGWFNGKMIISIWIHCDVCYQFDHHEMRKNDQACHGDITKSYHMISYNYYHIRCSHIIYHILPYIIIYVHIFSYHTWLVVLTVLKKISQLGLSLPIYIYIWNN